MADGDIVVIANPENTVDSNPSAPSVGQGMGNNPRDLAVRQNVDFCGKVLKQESDVVGEEVVVQGRRFKEEANLLAGGSTSISIGTFVWPCIGALPQGAVRGALLSLRFNLTNRNFGPGRAGANYANGGATSPIDINAADFLGYMKLEGGAGYLMTHEMAHTFKPMRDFNKAKFQEFVNRAGQGLNTEQAKAAFANTPEFKEVEARANTIARALYKQLSSGKDFGFTPTNDYAVC